MFSAEDRILFLAPHPDDESLAGGGILQRAFAQRVPTRVVYLTSGDNNPWAQRLVERRWRIDPLDQKRWGERRNAEAVAALRVLGGKEEDAVFCRYPDQGLTDLLMRNVGAVSDGLLTQLDAWRPTLVLLPDADDRHPDHSALHVLFSLATAASAPLSFTTLRYLVHAPKLPPADPAHTLQLTSAEVHRKRDAILAHETQVAGSRRRFTGYARPDERFYAEEVRGGAPGPVRQAMADADGVRVELAAGAIPSSGLRLLLAVRTVSGESLRWSLTVPKFSGAAFLRDEVTRSLLHPVTVRRNSHRFALRLPDLGPIESAFLKPRLRAGFFDRTGWIRLQGTGQRPRAGGQEAVTREKRDAGVPSLTRRFSRRDQS